MARKNEKQMPQLGGLHRVASAVRKMFSRGRSEAAGSESNVSMQASPAAEKPSPTMGNAPKPGRVTRRTADIPLETIGNTYTPPFTGGKAGFRSDGSDHGNDQEFAFGVADERWNDEDRLTNKSGDPRIGTHRRTYEPGEARNESRD